MARQRQAAALLHSTHSCKVSQNTFGIDMRLQSPWTPWLSVDPALPAQRLVEALASDIVTGKLEADARLPAHRALADELSLGIGTVTKAYGILERRGLVKTIKGRGTFVALIESRKGPLIDLSVNRPPATMTARMLAKTLEAVAKKIDSDVFSDYPPFAGHAKYRQLLTSWLASAGVVVDPSTLFLSTGAHHALSIALSVTCRPGDAVITDAQTYPGIVALAQYQGLKLIGIEMDEEGMLPAQLEKSLAASTGTCKAVYVTPTMQNPTTATMGNARRSAIVELCRRHQIPIIEDDVYNFGRNRHLSPIMTLAPELTFYINSVSKTLNPSLRIGALVVPASRIEATRGVLATQAIMASPLSCAVMEQWILDGTAEIITKAIEEESRRRTSIAHALLGDLIRMTPQTGYHVWLPMRRQDAECLHALAAASGILLTSPLATAASPTAEQSGVRICLGAPSIAELSVALTKVAGWMHTMTFTSKEQEAAAALID